MPDFEGQTPEEIANWTRQASNDAIRGALAEEAFVSSGIVEGSGLFVRDAQGNLEEVERPIGLADTDTRKIELLKEALAWIGDEYKLTPRELLKRIRDDEDMFTNTMDRASKIVQQLGVGYIDSLHLIEVIDWLESEDDDDDPDGTGGANIPRKPTPKGGGGPTSEAEPSSIPDDFVE